MILFWFSAEQAPPAYLPPSQPGVESGFFKFHDTHTETIKMHIIEFAENSADFQHFDPLHGQMTVPFTDVPIPGVTVNHSPTWACGKDADGEKHMAWFGDNASLNFLGKLIPGSAASAMITFVGPAGLVFFTFVIPNLGKIVLFQSHTPVEPLELKTHFRWYADPNIPDFLVWYICGNWVAQWRNDIDVWSNKVYAKKAMLVRGDGPLAALRRWYQQFYSEHSAEAAASDGAKSLAW
jgi:cholesterol 7-dehydrogenase